MASFPEICKRPQLGTSMPRRPSTPTLVARARATLPQVPRDHGAEFQHPAPHRLIGDIEPAFSEELFHVAVAQGEPEIKPNRVLDDRRREAMSAIREMDHARTLSYRLLLSDPVAVTLPACRTADNAAGIAAPPLPRHYRRTPFMVVR